MLSPLIGYAPLKAKINFMISVTIYAAGVASKWIQLPFDARFSVSETENIHQNLKDFKIVYSQDYK